MRVRNVVVILVAISLGPLPGNRALEAGSSSKKTSGTNPSSSNAAASLSKPVIAYGVLKLVDQGKLNLDAPLTTLRENASATRA